MKRILLFLVVMAISSLSYAALTGNKYIPGDYASIAAAITDLNTNGVGSGGVTFNIAANYTESVTAPLQITATGTATDPIVFQLDPATSGANPLITRTDAGSLATSTLGGQGDAVIMIDGGDYITFDKVSVSASDAGIEYGYYLRRASVTDGCKYVTIKNAVVTMTKGTSAYVVGIYSSNNDATSTVSSASGITLTSTGGRTENLTLTGNTVQNVFAGIVLRGYAAATPYDLYDQNVVVGASGAGNTIQNYAGNSAAAAWGVYLIYQTSPNVSYNVINNAGGGGANATSTLYGIFMSSSSAGGNFVANNNVITLGQGSTSGAHCIYNAQPCTSITINNNTFSYGTFASTTTSYLIYCSNATNNITVDGNATSGTITKTGAGEFDGYYNNGSPTSGTNTINNNNFSNISLTGASAFYGIRQTTGVGQLGIITNNTISNISGSTTSAIYGIYMGYGAAGTTVNGNNVYGISSAGAQYGLYLGSSAPVSLTAYNNNVNNLTTSGASSIYGIYNSQATDTKIYKNKIFNLLGTAAGSTVYGISIAGGVLCNVYNNFVSDLKASAATGVNAIVGINVGGGTTVNLDYNTIFMNAASSSVTTFGTSGIYTSTTPTVDLRNNNVVNLSVPVGTSYSAAHRRSGTATTTLTSTTGSNNYYVGSGTNRVIYYDGTTSYATVAAYKAALSPKESGSVEENPPFINVSSTPYDLHISTSTATLLESGGATIASITDDFDGNTRGATPDIGADEFAGIAAGVINPGAFTASVISSQQINLSYTLNPSNNNVLIVWNSTGTFTAPSGTPPAVGDPFAGGTVLSYGTTSPVNHTGLTAGTAYYYKAFSYNGTGYSDGVTANATPSVAPPTSLVATVAGVSQINLTWTLNAQSNDVVIANNSTSTFGTPVNGTTYIAGNAITGGGTVIYVGPLAAFNNTGLSAGTTYYYKAWSVDAFAYYSGTGATANGTTGFGVPYSQNFNASTSLPTAWGGTFYVNATHGNTTNGLTYNLYSSAPAANSTSPGVLLSANACRLVFDYRIVNYSSYPGTATTLGAGDKIDVKVSTDGGTNYTVLYTIDQTTHVTATTWANKVLALTGYNSQTVKIKFDAVWGTGDYFVDIDNFIIEEIPTCPYPTALAASGVTASGASISWASATTVDIDYGAAGHVAGSGTIVSNITTNPYALTGLTANTAYDVYIRQVCAPGNLSPWTGPVSFTTLCSAVSAPFNEPFTAAAIPSCWQMSGPQAWVFNTTWSDYGADALADHTSGGGGNYAGVDGSGSVSLTGITLLSPLIDVSSLTVPRLRFYMFNNNTSSTLLTDEQSLTIDLWNGSTWTNGVFTWAMGQNAAGWQEKVVTLSTYGITGPIQFRFVVDKGSGSPYYDDMIIDDVMVEESPACPAPTSLTAVAGGFQAVLGWTETGTATSWEIEWGTSGFTPTGTPNITGATNPYTLTGLTPVTGYAYYVRAYCSAGSQSAWTGPKTFTTTVACPAPTTVAASNFTKTTADLSWVEVGTATSWDIEYGPAPYTATGTPTISGVTTNPYTLEGLTAGTTYTYYVRSNCGTNGYSTWAGPVSFTTVCGEITSFPWTEGFETAVIPALKACWAQSSGAGYVTTNNANTTYDADAHTGTQFLREAWSATNEFIWTPGFTIDASTSYDFSFWWAGDTYSGWTGDVFVNTSPTDVGATQLGASFVVDATVTTKTYAQVLRNFTPTTAGTYYFAIRVNCPTSSPWYLSFDDFRFEQTPSCVMPSVLAASGVTSSSAIIGWTGAATVDIDYGAAGHTAGTGTILSNVTTNPTTLSGLTANTAYDVYIRQVCGVGNYSAWAGPISFTTLCGATVAPIIEDFELATFPSTCWQNVAVSGSYTWSRSTSASGYGAGTAAARANFYSQSSGTYDLITLPFDASAMATPTLKFDYAYATYSGEADELDIYTSNDNGSTWTLLLAMPGGSTGILNTGGTTTSLFVPTASQWGTQGLLLPAGTNRVKFQAISGYGNDLFLDNIKVVQPLANDVATATLDFGQVLNLGFTPMATVKNEGTATQTFNVTATIGAYTSTKTVTGLIGGAYQQVVFDAFSLGTGDYTASVCTQLAGDANTSNDCASKAIKVLDLNKQVYAYQNGTVDGPVKFTLGDPGTLNLMADQTALNGVFGGTWANGSWYGTVYNTVAPYDFISIDPTSGARTTIGDMGVGMTGLSYNPANGIMYGESYNSTTTISSLYSINMSTGVATLIGNSAANILLINLAIDNAGNAYAMDIIADVMGTVDLATGAFTVIGSTGLAANYAQDMEFDRETGDLYMAAYTSTGELRWVNKTTGSTLLVGQFQGGAEVTGFAIPYSSNKTLNVKVLFEGLALDRGVGAPPAGTMFEAYDENGIKWGAGIADQVTLELRDGSTGALVYSISNVNLSTSGDITATVPAAHNGSYYIYVVHRNSIITSSAVAVSFAGATASYDFTTGAAQAFGGNMTTMGAYSYIFAGDENQDYIVDSTDMNDCDNDSANFAAGYLVTDVNGDGIVDSSDMNIIDNNNALFVGSILPF